MSNRYQKTDPLMLYQQQKSHYEHILHPRFTIKMDFPVRKVQSLHHNNKSAHERDRHRKNENKKMLLTLLDIYNNKPGILSQAFEQDKLKSDQKRRSLYSSFKKQQMDRQIRKENRDLFNNLLKAAPSVGSHSQWDQHFQQHLVLEKKLRTHLAKQYFDINAFRHSANRSRHQRSTKAEKREGDKETQEQRPISLLLTSKGRRNKKLRKRMQKALASVEKPVQASTLLLQ